MPSSSPPPPPPSLPSLSTLPHAPDDQLSQLLNLLFEPSPALHHLCLPILRSTQFPDYAALIAAVRAQLHALADSLTPAETAQLAHILSSHPRLGDRQIDSEASRREQAQLQQSGHGDEGEDGAEEKEEETWATWNQAYEHKFPGLRYVVFVNGRSRPAILEDMRTRMARGDMDAERQAAIQAMCDIALDRANKVLLRSEHAGKTVE